MMHMGLQFFNHLYYWEEGWLARLIINSARLLRCTMLTEITKPMPGHGKTSTFIDGENPRPGYASEQ
jgi:hypothetical protein